VEGAQLKLRDDGESEVLSHHFLYMPTISGLSHNLAFKNIWGYTWRRTQFM